MKYNLRYKCSDLESLLRARGIEDIDKFLNPTFEDEHDPELLNNCKEAAKKIIEACNQLDKTIHLVVDCDQDGFTSAGMVYMYCKKIAPEKKIEYYIHTEKQHGLEDMLDILEEACDSGDLIVVPDAGSNDFEYHETLSKICDIVVIDHHDCKQESKFAIVVNNQMSENYPNKELSGAGVVYKVLEEIDRILHIDLAQEFIDLAAIGIIGDMTSVITPENRYIIDTGLQCIQNGCFKEIIHAQKFSIKDQSRPTPRDVSFYITPLINALIRVGTQSQKEVLFESIVNSEKIVDSTKRGEKGQQECITTQNARNCTNAKARQTRELTKSIDFVKMQIEKYNLNENSVILVEVDDEVPNPLTGLVAMKILEEYKKATLIFRKSGNFFKGSARANNHGEIKDFRAFCDNSGLFDFAEGHPCAFGESIPCENVKRFTDYANEKLASVNFNENIYDVDYVYDAKDGDSSSELNNFIFDVGDYKDIWGKDNEEPLIVVKNINVTKDMFAVMGKGTIKLCVNGITLIKFGGADLIDELDDDATYELTAIGTANVNEWNGRQTSQILVDELCFRDTTLDF